MSDWIVIITHTRILIPDGETKEPNLSDGVTEASRDAAYAYAAPVVAHVGEELGLVLWGRRTSCPERRVRGDRACTG